MKRVPYKIFDEIRMVPLVTYTNQKKDDPPKDDWHDDLWVERDEDWYALMSPSLKNKTVRIISAEEWARSRNEGIQKTTARGGGE